MIPTDIKVLQKQHCMQISYGEEQTYTIALSTLRQRSPAADNKQQPIPEDITVESIEPVGNYGIKIRFSDGHDTGIYRWELLRKLATAGVDLDF